MLHSSMTTFPTEISQGMSPMNQSTDHQYLKVSTVVMVNNHRYYFSYHYSDIATCTW